jgi:energy-converting hydrogenase Eha subunit A
LGTLPAAAAALVLQYTPPFSKFLFTAGWTVFVHNLCLLILLPYYLIFLLAVGTWVFPRNWLPPYGLRPSEIELIRFFAGSGVVGLIGIALGTLHLLTPWITIPIFLSGVFVQLQRSHDVVGKMAAWISDHGGAKDRATPVRLVFWAMLVLIGATAAYLILTKGLFPEIWSPDVHSVYLQFFELARNAHSIWMDPLDPKLVSFITFRGYGIYLFLTNVGTGYSIQNISLLYLGAMAFTACQVFERLMPETGVLRFDAATKSVLPLAVVLLVITSPVLFVEAGRLHFQDSALMLSLVWAAGLICAVDDDDGKRIALAMVPVAAYLAWSLPQSQAFILPVLAAAAACVYRSRKGDLRIRRIALLGFIGLMAAIASLLFNQLFAGIAAVNPMWPFTEFANIAKIERTGTSLDLLRYLAGAQGRVPGHVFAYIGSQLPVYGGLKTWIAAFAVPAFLFNSLRCFPVKVGAVVAAHLMAAFFFAAFQFQMPLGGVAKYALILALLVMAMPILFKFELRMWRFPGSAGQAYQNALGFLATLLSGFMLIWILTYVVREPIVLRVFQLRYAYPPILLCGLFAASAWANAPVAYQDGDILKKLPATLLLAMAGQMAGVMVLTTSSLFVGLLSFVSSFFAFKAVGADDLQQSVVDPEERDQKLAQMADDAIICLFGIACMFLAWSGLREFYAQQRIFAGSPIVEASSYFLGLTSLSNSLPTREFDRCNALDQIVPPGEPILALNVNLTLVADCSAVLPSGRIVGVYDAPFARSYARIVAGSATDAIDALKAAGVNYFYVARNDVQFWGPGWSEAFSYDSLRENFSVLAKDEKYFVLTWPNPSSPRLSEEEAREITQLRERARTEFPTWRGLAVFQR